MHWVDIAILCLFLLYVIRAGWQSRRVASESLEQYFLAGRTLSGWQAGISMAATQFAADTPLLITGIVAVSGIFGLWRIWIYGLSFLLVGFLLAGCWRRAQVLTDAELVEKRYGGGPAAVLRAVKALYLGTFFNIVVLAMVLLAATRVMEPFFPWHEWLPASVYQPLETAVQWIGVPLTISVNHQVWQHSTDNLISLGLIGLMTVFYSTTGGLRSVVKTDITQFALMLLATAGFAGLILWQVGGLEPLLDKLTAIFTEEAPLNVSQLVAFTPTEAKDFTLVAFWVLAVQWVAQINADGSGYLAQRMMACRTETESRTATIVFTVTQILVRSLLWLPIALGLLVLFPPDFSLDSAQYIASREASYVTGMMEVLPPGLKGIMLTAMLAALASTVDTHLNWGASYWTHDVYQRFWCQRIRKKPPNPQTLVWVARASNVCILFLAFGVMTQLSSIQTAWQASLLLGAGTGIPLLLRWVWWRFNVWGELLGLIASLIAIPTLLILLPGEAHDGLRLLILVGLSLGTSLLATWLLPAEPLETLQHFYEEVRPPGFWGPIAKTLATGSETKSRASFSQLWKGLGQTAGAAGSIFCLLVGVGSLLFKTPSTSGFLESYGWGLLILGGGVALSPFWLWPLRARRFYENSQHVETRETI